MHTFFLISPASAHFMTWLDKHRKIVNVSTIIISYRGSLIRLESHPAISPEDPKTLCCSIIGTFFFVGKLIFVTFFSFLIKKNFARLNYFCAKSF